jgi:cytochrome b6-f complex iron-sulfur subunit
MNERRRFLKVISAAAAASAVGAACGDDGETLDDTTASGQGGAGGSGGSASSSTAGGSMPPPPVNAGNVANIMEGELAAVPNTAMYLGRDAGGIYAMTSVCTHNSCDMLSRGVVLFDRLRCTCHGSEYDYDGAVLMGPATVALRHYLVQIEPDGTILVHKDETVDASVRAAA